MSNQRSSNNHYPYPFGYPYPPPFYPPHPGYPFRAFPQHYPHQHNQRHFPGPTGYPGMPGRQPHAGYAPPYPPSPQWLWHMHHHHKAMHQQYLRSQQRIQLPPRPPQPSKDKKIEIKKKDIQIIVLSQEDACRVEAQKAKAAFKEKIEAIATAQGSKKQQKRNNKESQSLVRQSKVEPKFPKKQPIRKMKNNNIKKKHSVRAQQRMHQFKQDTIYRPPRQHSPIVPLQLPPNPPKQLRWLQQGLIKKPRNQYMMSKQKPKIMIGKQFQAALLAFSSKDQHHSAWLNEVKKGVLSRCFTLATSSQ